MTKLSLILTMSLCSFTTQSKPVDDVCSHWSLQNGVAFFSHQDCDKFIQCNHDGLGKVVGVVQQCGFGTEWNQDLLTCVASSISTCPPASDKCYQLSNGEVRKAVGNCRVSGCATTAILFQNAALWVSTIMKPLVAQTWKMTQNAMLDASMIIHSQTNLMVLLK